MASVDDIRVMMINAQKTYQDLALLLEKAEASANPPPSIGTKFKWVSETNPETYRIAIVTNNGFLQVKSVTDGAVECDTSRTIGGTHPLIKKLFANEMAWRTSLPQGKTELSLSTKITEAKRADEVFKTLSDVEKVDALRKRYKIWHCVMKHQSYQERLTDSVTRLNNFRVSINNLSYDQMIEHGVFNKNRGFTPLLNSYAWNLRMVKESGAAANTPNLRYGASGTGAICATMNGQKYFITTAEGKIAAVLASCVYGEIKFYKDFAEMGNPAISVLYRKRVIPV